MTIEVKKKVLKILSVSKKISKQMQENHISPAWERTFLPKCTAASDSVKGIITETFDSKYKRDVFLNILEDYESAGGDIRNIKETHNLKKLKEEKSLPSSIKFLL